MSEKPATAGVKPQPPKLFKGKLKVTVALDPKPTAPADAQLTVLPTAEVPKAEDSSAAPSFASVAPRRGMFTASSVAVPGIRPERRRLTAQERLFAPLMGEGAEEQEEEQEAVEAEAAALPPPPPLAAPKPVVAQPSQVVLPPIGKEFLGEAMKPKKLSYADAAVKRRMTDEIADTLIELGNQLEERKFAGLDLEEGTGLTSEGVQEDKRTLYRIEDGLGFEESASLSEAKLTALDPLFPSLRIRMMSILGEGKLASGSTDPIAKDYQSLLRLIAYAPKYKQDKPRIALREKKAALLDLMTDETAKVLLELEASLTALTKQKKGLHTMKETPPTTEGQPFVYTFEDGTTLLPVGADPEARKQAERGLAMLTPLFPGGSKIGLTTITGMGPYDAGGTPLNEDLQFLQDLFTAAKTHSKRATKVQEKLEAKAEALEAVRAKTLEGTPYEALAKPIDAEMAKSPYEVTTDSAYTPGTYEDKKKNPVQLPKQTGFIPPTRRAFGYFIYDKFRRYMLKAMDKLDPNACSVLGGGSDAAQIYEYQKFVRDYISYMTPYRGVLVYHGLGSGKTCTAIAASEALLSSGGKKRIIVMTPFSLRKNFIQQITFCGFRHFRLKNVWTPHEYRVSDGPNALWLFATSVLQIPESYLRQRRGKPLTIWIPDLTRPASEENYSKLTPTQQGEIRQQIYETLVYDPDPKKGKNGLIWFISYNGVSSTQLQDWACRESPEGVFDNSVIVVDEIHNLIRLMQGTIDPYLKKLTVGQAEAERTGDPKYLDPDQITADKWKPKLCKRTTTYKRGYLFYRLLTQAKNTKIVGLSGTPLINFPEELGILANVLHGYTFVYKTSLLTDVIKKVGAKQQIQKALTDMADGKDPSNFCPHVDFFEIVIEDQNQRIECSFTFLPEGYRKIQGQLGVERIPPTEPLATVKEKEAALTACVMKAVKSVEPQYPYAISFKERPEPLLPVMGESSFTATQMDDSFKGRFVGPDGVSLINEQVLLKRLSGLISYYKGSRKDLMPEIKEDKVLRIPMSLDQQRKYIAIRLQEIKQEEKKKKDKGVPEGRGDEAELKKLSSSQNYRMASRQACNFVFPDGFTRPRPVSAAQLKQSNEQGGITETITGDEQAPEASALERSSEEEAVAAQEESQAIQVAQKEDEDLTVKQEEEEIAAKQKELRDAGKSEGEIQAVVKEIQDRFALLREGAVVLAGPEETEAPTGPISKEQERCLANMLPGETYQQAIDRSKECLRTLGRSKLQLVDASDPSKPSPLQRWSPKYKTMLETIGSLPGSSLVYSQFLGMEGIGLFTIVMEANGYAPIRIVSRDGQLQFDEATEASFRKGPADPTPRFILFTGGEDENIRKVNIDVFNAKFSELPPKVAQVLQESGFTEEIGNKQGQLCRVFCITAAGAEGLSLKNVRGVHIMEPYWNDVRMAQVKGRAVRICSHQELPLKERNVSIYTYVSVFDKVAQDALGNARENERMKWAIPQEIWNRDSMDRATAESFGLRVSSTKGEYAMTSDERLFYISERKKKLVANLTVIMKTAAADCLLNYKENRDGTYVCRLLGNEGDFLYHPNLQRDIETSKHDEIGDLFKVPEKEIQRIKAEDAKLRFEEEKEEEAAPVMAAEAPVVPVGAPQEGVPAPVAAPPVPKPALPPKPAAAKRIKYKIGIKGTEYVISAVPDAQGKVSEFLIYKPEDLTFSKPVGRAEAEFDAGKQKWLPKKDSAVIKQ